MGRALGPMDDSSSWAESLQRYQAARTTRPAPDEAYAKPERITRRMRAAEEVSYNPLLQTFTSADREGAARESERKAVVSHLNNARDRQIASESPFNILSMVDKRSGLPSAPERMASSAPRQSEHFETPTFRHPLDSCYPYNIVSNIGHSEHHYAAPALRPGNKTADAADVAPPPKLQNVKALPRDFNILSNKYRENHEAKMDVEHELQRRTAARKYWETHDYDCMSCKYYNPEKEADAKSKDKATEAAQPTKQFNRLPPSMQRGEGYVYDITSHQVKNEALYARKSAAEQRWLDSKKETWGRDAAARQRGIEQKDLEDNRALNRASHRRYFERYAHGFSIIDHRDYTDPSTYLPPCRTMPPRSLWGQLGEPTKPGMPSRDRPRAAPRAEASAAVASSAAPDASAGPPARKPVRTGGFQ